MSTKPSELLPQKQDLSNKPPELLCSYNTRILGKVSPKEIKVDHDFAELKKLIAQKRKECATEAEAYKAIKQQLIDDLSKTFKFMNPGSGLDLLVFTPVSFGTPRVEDVKQMLLNLQEVCLNYTKEDFQPHLQTFVKNFAEHLVSKLTNWKPKHDWEIESEMVQFLPQLKGLELNGLELLFKTAAERHVPCLYELSRIEFSDSTPKKFIETYNTLLANYKSRKAQAGATS